MQKSVLYALALVFVISCQPKKDDDLVTPAPEPAKKCRLVKMIQGTNNGAAYDTTFNFYYDASGKLTKVIEVNTGYNYTDTFLVSYNNGGQLESVIQPNLFANYFKYNTSGTLAEVTTTGGLYDTVRFRYEYTSSTIPQKSTRYQHSRYFKTWDTLELRYTNQNGNIVTSEAFSKGVSVGKSNYEYDTIPNFNGDVLLMSIQYTVPLGHYEEFYYFNKNVLKRYSNTANNSTSSYYINYKTDSGRITKSVINGLKSPAFTDTTGRNTRNYFYECL